MNKKYLIKLTTAAVLAALVTVMNFTPFVGYIPFAGLSITTLHIPVILGAVLLGPVYGAVLGAVWGIDCLIYALLQGTPDAIIFTNPLISVVPRILVGLVAGLLAVLLARKIKKGFLVSLISTFVGTVTNTVLVLTAIWLFGSSGLAKLSALLTNIISVAVSVNGIVELAAALVIVTAVAKALEGSGIYRRFIHDSAQS